MIKGEKMKAPTKDKTRHDLQTWKHKFEQAHDGFDKANKHIKELELELERKVKMLLIAWDAVEESGYEDFNDDLKTYMENNH